MQRSLEVIGRENLISPLMVLQIVEARPNLKFKVLKSYLLARLENQERVIRKNQKKVDENMEKIKGMKEQTKALKTTAKLFQTKDCNLCGKKLSLSTVHFMCEHVFHDYCVEGDGKKQCRICAPVFQETVDKRNQFLAQADDNQQFRSQLNSEKVKFNFIAQYFGRGLFNGVNQLGLEDRVEEGR